MRGSLRMSPSIRPAPATGTRATRPTPRSVETASSHGIDISAQRARQVEPADFDRFDLILAMDRSNEATLRARSPSGTPWPDQAVSGLHAWQDRRRARSLLRRRGRLRGRLSAVARGLHPHWRRGLAGNCAIRADRLPRSHRGPPPTESRDDITTNRPTVNGMVRKLPRAPRYSTTSPSRGLRSRASDTCGENRRGSGPKPSRWQIRSISACSALSSGEGETPAQIECGFLEPNDPMPDSDSEKELPVDPVEGADQLVGGGGRRCPPIKRKVMW